ncbi:MAG: protein translocase subunit SecD [Burkholderiales bacterium]|nr:protein translocase subunit SecD [Burkholderiales bacterium]OUT77646.1 MAG: protein translocase subunit SecD [Betaproteobacteria bacterium TMED22]|tara:strand:+ start:4523 stop:6379 length:1857 start_codon:yes stop_codon:yes gene_type:complete
MNRYPLWKYLIIVVAVIAGVVYTIPNFFGESPAIQVSPLRAGAKVDLELLKKIDELLTNEDISVQASYLDKNGIKVRFEDTDAQLKGKDIIQSGLGKNYVVALNLLPNSPDWLTSLNALPMYLGLDLRGGVHFLLQVDMPSALQKARESYLQDLRQVMRSENIRYSKITAGMKTIDIEFRDESLRDQAAITLEIKASDLNYTTDERSGIALISAQIKPEIAKRIQEFALQQNITTLRNRVNELGVAEPIVQQSGADRVVVQLPGVQDTAKAKDILGRTATLEVRLVDEDKMDPASLQAAQEGRVPSGDDLIYDREGTPYLLKKEVILTGDRISDAQPGFDNTTSEPAVHLSLDGRGSSIFQMTTRENVGRRIAMVLVDKGSSEVVTAPVVRAEIPGGRVQISGSMTTTEAHDTALLLRAGALAAPMEIIEERTVGPSLGADNIERGFKSTWIGFAALALFIAVYYALFGVISVFALSVNMMLLAALLSMLQATLTLPGIAAVALTLGMAIDANVLINERIREEIRNGTTPQAAITAGYERAWGTILDSNITTLIAGIALFFFGTGPIRGFAVVHCIGILTSMFSAVFVSRGVVNFIYGRKKRIERLAIGDSDWYKEPK